MRLITVEHWSARARAMIGRGRSLDTRPPTRAPRRPIRQELKVRREPVECPSLRPFAGALDHFGDRSIERALGYLPGCVRLGASFK